LKVRLGPLSFIPSNRDNGLWDHEYHNGTQGQFPVACVLSISGIWLRVPVTIELPELASQTKVNLACWAEILADPALANLPHRIENDQHGHILMSPPPALGNGIAQYAS
jgi:hypothetical protein